MELLKIHPSQAADGELSFQMKVEERHLRTFGIVHGGVVASLLDSALGFAAWSLTDNNHHVVTVQLNINFIRPAWEGESLIAKGRAKLADENTIVSEGEIRTDDGITVAVAIGTFMSLPLPKDMQTIEKHDEMERCDDATNDSEVVDI